jgi:hypothetical protein
MKKTSAIIFIHLWIIFSIFSAFAQDFNVIQDGVEYTEIKRGTENEPIKINLLRLDLTKVRLDVVHALDAAIGTETVSSIATRHGAFAAINAGFFRLDKSIFAGDATGVLMVDKKLLSEPYGNRIALFIKNNSQKSEINFSHFDLSQSVKFKDSDFPIEGINRQRKDDELVLFTPEFHGTTLTNSDGLEIIVRNGKISQIFNNKGSSSIPSNGFVLSASGIMREFILKAARIGEKVKVRTNGKNVKSNVSP